MGKVEELGGGKYTGPSLIEAAEHAKISGVDGKKVFVVDSFGNQVSEGSLATKIITDSSNTYIAEAAPGTALTTAKWRCQKVDSAGNITWADGNANFDNQANDLISLTYS